MENIKEFTAELSGVIKGMLPVDLSKDLEIMPITVTKMNDQVLHGLTFKSKDGLASPTIYLNDAYKRNVKGEPLASISAGVIQIYLDSLITRPAELPKDLDFESIKDALTIRVLEIKRNVQYLQNVPYMPVGNGLALVCDLKIKESDEGFWRTTVTKDIMKDQGYDLSEMFMNALSNAEFVDPPVMDTIQNQMFGLKGTNYLEAGRIADEDKVPMYVLTNESTTLGAAALFYPGVQEKIAENLGESYYVIPSSVHECLIVPESIGPREAELSEMLVSTNATMVDPKDVLSDTLLHYDKDARSLTAAGRDNERTSLLSEAR